MSKVQVFKNETNLQIGKGDGEVNTAKKTAEITKWEQKAGLLKGHRYRLKSKGKIFDNAECIDNELPVKFKILE